MAPPGIPADRLEILRNAFDATLRDPPKIMLDNGLVVFAAIFIRAVRSACDSTNKEFFVADVKKLAMHTGPDRDTR